MTNCKYSGVSGGETPVDWIGGNFFLIKCGRNVFLTVGKGRTWSDSHFVEASYKELAMRKAIVMMLLAVVSSSAAAEWVSLGTTDNGTTVYVDPATIRRSGGMVEILSLFDLKTAELTPQGWRYTSQKSQQEYDCKEKRWRVLSFSQHSGNMGGGISVYVDSNPGNWLPVAPGSEGRLLWERTCGKQ
jgi:hypothetical protein